MTDPVNAFEWVALPQGLVVPQSVEARGLRPEGLPDVAVYLRAEWDPLAQSYEVVRMQIDSPRGVTGTVLRGVAVKSLLRSVLQSKARVYKGDGSGSEPAELDRVHLRVLAGDGPTPETLAAVGLVYLLADVALEPPAKRVREEFGIPQRTASHWIKLARERGHLPDLRGDDGEHQAEA